MPRCRYGALAAQEPPSLYCNPWRVPFLRLSLMEEDWVYYNVHLEMHSHMLITALQQLNMLLIDAGATGIKFGDDCLPHVTLAMTCFKRKDAALLGVQPNNIEITVGGISIRVDMFVCLLCYRI